MNAKAEALAGPLSQTQSLFRAMNVIGVCPAFAFTPNIRLNMVEPKYFFSSMIVPGPLFSLGRNKIDRQTLKSQRFYLPVKLFHPFAMEPAMKNFWIIFLLFFCFPLAAQYKGNADGPYGSIVFHPSVLVTSARFISPQQAPDYQSAVGVRINLLLPLHRYFTATFSWESRPIRYALTNDPNPPQYGWNFKTWEVGFKFYLF